MSIPEILKQATSVSSQVEKAASLPIKDVSSALGSLKSSASSIGDSLGNVSAMAGKLGALGLGGITAVSSAFKQLGKLGNYSKFSDTFKPPSKVKGLAPEQTKNRPPGNFTFPSDIGDYFIKFTFKSYERTLPLGNRIDLPTCVINLPIPQSLQEQFNMQYADKQLGIAGFLEDVIGDVVKGGTTPQAFEKAGERVRKEVFSSQGAYYAGRTLAGLSDSVGAAVDKATGVILNPFQSLIFQGISLRQHSFTYRFSPNSSSESQTLRGIIKELKTRMHPQKDGLIYQFPDVCDITFGNSGNPYFFKTCFLESMSVNYAPAGQPSFFAETKLPTEVEISFTFKEIEPLTREDFDERFVPLPTFKPARTDRG